MTETFYRRRLPHWLPERAQFFLTWRLDGSLPKHVVERLREEKRRLEREPARPDESSLDRSVRMGKRMFLRWDGALAEILKSEEHSVRWLGLASVARAVAGLLREKAGELCRLHRYVIMPNHVHLLLEPLADPATGTSFPLQEVTRILKGSTSRLANQVLGRTGAFWQPEGFDHWVRDHGEQERIVAYIDENPVKAGLCGKPAEWPWGSAGEDNAQ